MTYRVALAGTLAVALAVLSPPARAAPPLRVTGYECRALAASTPKSGIWWAAFYGERVGAFDMREWTHQVRCFKNEAACKAWLYWEQSDWPNLNQVNRCRRGLPY